jgi:hypothetical protein
MLLRNSSDIERLVEISLWHGGATMKKIDRSLLQGKRSDYDLDSLLHPERAFEHPRHVLSDPDLTLNEKRAILASWASDACAIEASPSLRSAPGMGQPVRFDDIMDALRALDRQATESYRAPPGYRRVLEKRIPGVFGRTSRTAVTVARSTDFIVICSRNRNNSGGQHVRNCQPDNA